MSDPIEHEWTAADGQLYRATSDDLWWTHERLGWLLSGRGVSQVAAREILTLRDERDAAKWANAILIATLEEVEQALEVALGVKRTPCPDEGCGAHWPTALDAALPEEFHGLAGSTAPGNPGALAAAHAKEVVALRVRARELEAWVSSADHAEGCTYRYKGDACSCGLAALRSAP